MRVLGAPLALLLAALPAAAQSDSAWTSSLPLPLPIAVPAPAPGLGAAPKIPAIPRVSWRGLRLKAVSFSSQESLSAPLIKALDKTEKTALLALYDLRLSELAEAVLRAKGRGVDVRVVYDEGHGKAGEPGTSAGPSPELQSLLDAGIPVKLLKGGGSFGIMHQKFMVLDGELLETGSFNWTRAAEERHFENVMFRKDRATVDGYARAWDWMWKVEGGAPGTPPVDPEKPVKFEGGSWPRFAFSPQGGIEDMLVDAIGRAKSTIDVPIFSMYSQRVADALIAAKKRKVVVRVAADAGQAKRSQAVLSLSKAGVGLRLSGGRAPMGVMHHKYAIVDGKWLMTGSYNFSQNAELYNYENVFFSDDPAELGAFGEEFARVWDQAREPADGDLAQPK